MENWQKNYNMSKLEWKEPYFIKLIGGIRVSKKEKELSLARIQYAIKNNNKKIKTLLNKEIILKAYPESLDLLGEYYQSLNNAFQGERNFDEDKQTMLLIYIPYLSQLSLEQIHTYMEKLDIDFKNINQMMVLYKKVLAKSEKLKKDLTKDTKNDLSLLKQMMNELISTDINVAGIMKKYGITNYTFKTYLDKIKENDIELYNKIQQSILQQTNIDWKNDYSMKKGEWKKEYFQNLVGGIKVSKEEKEVYLNNIKDAIEENKKGHVTELNKEIILKAYPESINLLNDYYESLIYAHKIESNSEYKMFDQYKISHNKKWRDVLIQDRNTMLHIYVPYLSKLPQEELEKYAKMFDLNLKYISDMLPKDKQFDTTQEQAKKSKSNDKKYDLVTIKQLVNDISLNNEPVNILEKKYKIGASTLSTYMNQLKELDEVSYHQVEEKLNQNNEKYFMKIKWLIAILHEYITNGIQDKETILPFTMLDYYCISKVNVQDIIDYLKTNPTFLETKQYRNNILSFLNKSKNVGPFISDKALAQKEISISYKEKVVKLDLEFSTKIINYLKENNIPINYNIVYTAARRQVRGETILPLLHRIPEKQIIDNHEAIRKRV